MATYHIDLINGDDANDGSSWELAKKTIPISGTHEIKIAKSPDPVSTGISASLTKYSREIILSSPLTKTIDRADGNTWTVSPNVTGGTYNTYRKLGSMCQQFAIATAFTTGKIAYKTMAATDFSSFTKVSFWLSVSSITTAPAANLRLCLCSDTTGDTIVNSIPVICENTMVNYLFPTVLDYGAALGSNIQSVALYADTDTAALTLRINNIEAVNEIDHNTLIGISSLVGSRWYGIDAIAGNTILVAEGFSSISGQGYCEETGEYVLYYRKPIRYMTQNNLSGSQNLQFLFGYNTLTDLMDGETWLDCLIQYNRYAFNLTTSAIVIKNLGIYRTGKAILGSTTTMLTIENLSIINCVPLNGSVADFSNATIDGLRVLNCTPYADNNGVIINSGASFKNIDIHNFASVSSEYFASLKINSLAAEYENISIGNNVTGLIISGNGNHIKDITFDNTYYRDLRILAGGTVFENILFTGKSIYDVVMGSGTLIKNSIDMLTQANWPSIVYSNFHMVYESNFNNAEGNNRVWINQRTYATRQTSFKRSGDSQAWLIGGLSYTYTGNETIRPALTLAEIAVSGGSEITISVWTHSLGNDTNRLVIRPDNCAIVSEEVSVSIPANAAGDWQLTPITLIPIKDGVLVLEVLYMSGNLYIGSIQIS